MELCSGYNVAVWGVTFRVSLVMLPGLTAVTEGRFCWPSSSQDALLDGCWSSPSPLFYLERCAAAWQQNRNNKPDYLAIDKTAVVRLYLSLKFPLFCFEFIFDFLRVVCWCFVSRDLTFKSVNLENSSEMCCRAHPHNNKITFQQSFNLHFVPLYLFPALPLTAWIYIH